MKTKIIPFDLEMAKKIQAGEIEGKIKTRAGEEVRIICWDRKTEHRKPIIALIDEVQCEVCCTFSVEGEFSSDSQNDLVLEVPDNEPQFKPFDKVLVRSGNDDSWEPRLFARYVKYPDKEELYYYTQDDTIYDECIPYEGHEHLVGTTDKPE